MFRIISVPDHAADATEPLGTKPKFWFRDDEGRRCLYKEGRPGTGEDWSEKAASELCSLIGLPHVDYELALSKNRRGVICHSMVPPNGHLIHGNELLARVVPEYPQTKFFRVRQHTVKSVLAVLRSFHIGLPLDWNGFESVQTAQEVFIGYLIWMPGSPIKIGITKTGLLWSQQRRQSIWLHHLITLQAWEEMKQMNKDKRDS